APVLHEGVVYFGAGIWPEEGVYVCALRVATGALLWRCDSLSLVPGGMSDHGQAYDLSLPPQGYLAVVDGRLAVPSGRSLAAWFDLDTGVMEPYTCYYVKTNPPRGTWYVCGTGRFWVQGGNWFGTRPEAAPPLPAALENSRPATFGSRQPPPSESAAAAARPFLRADTYRLHNENLYTEPVLTETTAFAAEFAEESSYLVPRGHTHVAPVTYDRIVARDLTRPTWRTVNHLHLGYGRQAVPLQRLEFPLLWELASPLRVLIKAGDRLYAGGDGQLAAIAIPARGEAPRIAWEVAVPGTPVHALVADGRLVAVTDSGRVLCFGDTPPASPRRPEALAAGLPAREPVPPYAWLIGWGDGRRARELARRGSHRVIVTEPDPATARAARETLAREGLHSDRVQVITGSPETLSLPPYWADRVEFGADPSSPQAVGDSILDAMRPYSGTLLLPPGWPDALPGSLPEARPEYVLERNAEKPTLRRLHPPPGAADWTHEAGSAANGFANAERRVKWPLGVLWYSGDIDRYFTPASHFQHERHPYPLVAGGRMFLITGQFLHAVDIYTGRYLWRAEMPLTPWIRSRFFDSRIYGRPTERNGVAAPDRVYTVLGDVIHAYDAATGALVHTFAIPPDIEDEARARATEPREEAIHGQRGLLQGVPPWTEVRLWKGVLLAMLGRHLVALDRHSGALLWRRAGRRETTTYALGEEMLYGLDCDDVPFGGYASPTPRGGVLFALAPGTGALLWERPIEYGGVPEHNVEHPRPWLRPVLPEVAWNAKHGLIVLTVNRNSVQVFRGEDGAPVWSRDIPPAGNLQAVYPPVVTDDFLVLSNYRGCYGYLLDVTTGREKGDDTGIPRPRTCARILGNSDLLVYRDAATELYDVAQNRMIQLNSVRSGCTTSFIPAGGVLTAPMLGHGCVCNYPMFASLGLFHWPASEGLRPEQVTASWRNQLADRGAARIAGPLDDEEPAPAEPAPSGTAGAGPATDFGLRLNASLEPAPRGMLFRTLDAGAGYALRPAEAPLRQATFTLSAVRAPGTNRHGNAFLVLGTGATPADWLECRLYYGGRSSLMLTGKGVETKEEKVALQRGDPFVLTATVDCAAGTLTFEVSGHSLTTRLTNPIQGITHYGYGGANADTVFSPIRVR
ncbi:MAG: PQQ-binding-like beta-propeller repeat protein, partial [Lentisphaeria bacterium]|nr:PQQ-binding-like beta-propeller repeat protein [Lentisphaeria bacterium]